MRASSLLQLLAMTTVAACGGRAAPEAVTPEPAPAPAPPPVAAAPVAPAPKPDDSAERARAEEAARAERTRAVAADLATMIHFDYDQATIRSADQPILDKKAAILQANPNVHVRISGHTDDRGSDEYNLALGNRRAAAAKRYLKDKGVDESRIEVVSYGEERPLDQGKDENSWAQNRRAEFEITAGGDNLVPAQ